MLPWSGEGRAVKGRPRSGHRNRSSRNRPGGEQNMANFNDLERALREWVNEAVARLSDVSLARVMGPPFRQWHGTT
jgi:hypothetical protein